MVNGYGLWMMDDGRPAGIVRSAGPAQKVFRLCLLASPCYKL